LIYPTLGGRYVFFGIRQSIPSSNIDNCAPDTWIFPALAAGQTNRPFSRRLLNKPEPYVGHACRKPNPCVAGNRDQIDNS
jgi:hypothetical protein